MKVYFEHSTGKEDAAKELFAVINADNFYGRDAFERLPNFYKQSEIPNSMQL